MNWHSWLERAGRGRRCGVGLGDRPGKDAGARGFVTLLWLPVLAQGLGV